MCAKMDWQLHRKGRWVSESWQPVMTAPLGWVCAGWRETKRKEALPSGKSMPLATAESVFCSACAGFGLIFIPVQYTPWNIYMFGNINKENETKQNKKMHTQHTTQNGIVLLCFAFAVTQIVVIISLALQAFSFILKAVFGIALHLTQFNK